MYRFKKQLRLLVFVAVMPFTVAGAQQLDTEIDGFLSDYHPKNGQQPLAGHGPHFESEGSTYNVDPRLVTAIAGAETSFGAYTASPNNAFNWFWNAGTGSHNSPFDNWDSGIHTVSHYLQKSYLLKGYTTIPLIGARYCRDGCEHWIPNVTNFYQQMGANPAGALTYPAAIQPPPAPTPTPASAEEAPALTAALSLDSASKGSGSQNIALIVQATVENLASHATVRSVDLYREDQAAPVKLVSLKRVPGSADRAPVFSAAFILPASDTGARLQVRAQVAQKGHVPSQLTTSLLDVPKPPSQFPWLVIGISIGGAVLLACIVVLCVLLLRRKSSPAPQPVMVQTSAGTPRAGAMAATMEAPLAAKTGTDGR
jgi:hypothetical protein